MPEDPTKNPEDAKSPAVRHSDARRRLLKTIAVGGAAGAAVPDKWTKPVVEAVLLPAHAQATGCQCAISSVNVNVDATIDASVDQGSDATTDNIDQDFNASGALNATAGGLDAIFSTDTAVVVVTAQLPTCVLNGTGPFNLAVDSIAGDLSIDGTSLNANASGGVVTFGNVLLESVDIGDGFRVVITPPAGCGSPREISITFQSASPA